MWLADQWYTAAQLLDTWARLETALVLIYILSSAMRAHPLTHIILGCKSFDIGYLSGTAQYRPIFILKKNGYFFTPSSEAKGGGFRGWVLILEPATKRKKEIKVNLEGH